MKNKNVMPPTRLGFVPGHYSPEVLLPATLDPLALIQRWKQYTQGRAVSRLLVDSLIRRRHHRVARVAFDGWRKGMGPRQRRAAAAMEAAIVAAAAVGTRSKAFAAAAASGKPASPSARDGKEAAVAALEMEQQQQEGEEEGDKEAEEGGYGDDPADGDSFGLGTGAGHSRLLRRSQHQKVPFVEARTGVDLAVARRTVIAGWRAALTRAVGLRQAKQEWQVKRDGRRRPT